MEKKKHYHQTKFTQDVIQEAYDNLRAFVQSDDELKLSESYSVQFESESWDYDSESEFFADYKKDNKHSSFRKNLNYGERELSISSFTPCVDVTVCAPSRWEIEKIHQIFDSNSAKCAIPVSEKSRQDEPVIFLGHGRSQSWRDLKDHLQDKHGYKIQAYEVGARAGHTIRDILEEMLRKSSFALLVMSGEDEGKDGILHARENVIHEVGLFQGKLGFHRAIVLLEEGTNEFSNLHGIQQIRYAKKNIKETYGEVLATLKREFDA